MATDQINCTAAQAVAVARQLVVTWGAKQYTYAWPPLPLKPLLRPANEPWCDDFTRLVHITAGGFDIAKRVDLPAFCPATMAYEWGSPYWISQSVDHAQAGDIGFSLRGGTGPSSAYHTWMVDGPRVGNWLPIVCGDGSSPRFPGSESLGGVAVRKSYWLPALSCHIFRPPYKPAPPPPTDIALMTGSTGVHVKHLQAGLDLCFPAYAHLTVDGVFGQLTAAAVKQFQTRTGLTADGIVGPLTTAKLHSFGITL